MKKILLVTTILATFAIAGSIYANQAHPETSAQPTAELGLPGAALFDAIAEYETSLNFGSTCVPYAVSNPTSCFYEALSACGNVDTYNFNRFTHRCCYICGIPPR